MKRTRPTRPRSGTARSVPARRSLPAPNLRKSFIRAAAVLGVPVEDAERALILGQIAELLVAHPRIGRALAFKGGAIMRLVDRSPRLSRDLDGSAVAGQRIRRGWIEEALSTTAARRVVFGLPIIWNENRASIVIPVIECRPLSGQSKVVVSLSINWDDPLLEEPEQRLVEIAGRRVALPVMTARERAAEKVRAFLTRGEAADAHDLYYYGSGVLAAPDRRRLPDLIRRKLQRARLPDTDLHVRWDEMAALAESSYARGEGLLLVAAKAPWSEVQRQLRRFKAAIPDRMSGSTAAVRSRR